MTRRLISAFAVLSFFGTAVVLLLSDRAGKNAPILTSNIRKVGRRVEAITGIDVVDREQIPFDTDLLGHAALWFGGMLIVGFALRKRIPVIAIALVMMAIGIGFEFGQFYWTQGRQMSGDDAIANSVGVAAAAIVVMVVGGIIDIITYVVTRLRNRRQWVEQGPTSEQPAAGWSQLGSTVAQPAVTAATPISPADPWFPPGHGPSGWQPNPAPTWRYGDGASNRSTTAEHPVASVTTDNDPDALFRPQNATGDESGGAGIPPGGRVRI